MAGYLNKAMIIGNLGRDPEMRYTQGGTAMVTLNVATNRRWRDRDGNEQDDTEWHRVVAWGKLAELCNEYLSKGSSAYFEGRLQTRKYDDREGITRWTTEIVAREMQIIGSRRDRPDEPADPDDDLAGEPIDVDDMPF